MEKIEGGLAAPSGVASCLYSFLGLPAEANRQFQHALCDIPGWAAQTAEVLACVYTSPLKVRDVQRSSIRTEIQPRKRVGAGGCAIEVRVWNRVPSRICTR